MGLFVSSILPAAAQGGSSAGVRNHAARVDHQHSSLKLSQVLFTLTADMNVLTDQSFVRSWAFDQYLIQEIRAYDASVSLTAADGGIYTAAAKGGSAIVAAAQVYTALDAATKGLLLTLNALTLDALTATPILSLTGTQGGAATAKLVIIGIPLSVSA